MTRLSSCGAVAVVGLASLASAAASHDVDVRTSVDRTAVWVADRVTYTITIACNKGVDILADDLSKDKLRGEGLDVVGSDSERSTDGDDKTTYTFHYQLTTYRVDVPELQVAPLTVRYYVKRPGQRLEDAAPAGEVQVPATIIAFRSALLDGQQTYDIRDGRGLRPRRLRYAWLQPIAAGLVLIAIVPATVFVVIAVGRARPRARSRSARQVWHDQRALLDAVRALDISTVGGRRDAYSRLNALVRDHLQRVADISVGLTPPEIEVVLSSRGTRVPVEVATAVLAACELARYAPPAALPSFEACRQAIEQSEQILAVR